VGRSKLSVVRDGRIFLQSILWTALTYNPVRILGLLGIAFFLLTGLIGLGLVVMRLSGVTSLSAWGVASLFIAMVAAVTGVNLFALGITFNYLVSLFYKREIHQGLFGKPIFKTPLDRQFWWIGLLSGFLGFLLGVAVLMLGLNGWEIARLWLYMLASALLFLVGMQLFIYWVLFRILDELAQREILVKQDMNGAPVIDR
jgi:hypothetical protein